MRKVVFSLIIAVCVACGGGNSSDFIEGSKIGAFEVKSMIGNLNAEKYDPAWIDADLHRMMIKDLYSRIQKGEYTVYDYIPDTLIELSKEELDYKFYHVDTDYVEVSAYENDTIAYEETLDPEDVVYLKFKEELYYNSDNGAFGKKVKMVCPMEEVFNEDGSSRGHKGLFWIKLN